MASSIFRSISQRVTVTAAESCYLRWISHGKGIFSLQRNSNFCGGCKLLGAHGHRLISSSTNRISPLPWLMLPPAFEGGAMVYNFYSLGQNKVLSFNKRSGGRKESELPDDDATIVGSSHGWLALFNQRNCDLFLSNPLSGRHIKLPPIHTLPIPEENLEGGYGCVSKVIISSSPDEEECRAMMTFGTMERLAFCYPGRSTEWTPIGALVRKNSAFGAARCYEDFVYSNRLKLFFCLTEIDSDDLEGWDLKDPGSPRIDWSDEDMLKCKDEDYPLADFPWAPRSEELKEYWCRPLRYLVFAEQSNQLFLVTRHLVRHMAPDGVEHENDSSYPYKTIGFDVYKIDRKGRKLSYIEGSLDGLAMFVGLNHSFAMTAAEFSELKPNSIYFTDDKLVTPPKWVDSIYGGHDIGIFNYENRTITPCYYPCDLKSVKRIMPAPMWFTPSVCAF